MSQSTTSFTYGALTVVMDLNPVVPRSFTEKKEFPSDYDSDGEPYAYDAGAPTVRTEQIVFPAISTTNIDDLLSFLETIKGAKTAFTWNDQGTTRTARYTGCSYQQISPNSWQLSLTLEVLS